MQARVATQLLISGSRANMGEELRYVYGTDTNEVIYVVMVHRTGVMIDEQRVYFTGGYVPKGELRIEPCP